MTKAPAGAARPGATRMKLDLISNFLAATTIGLLTFIFTPVYVQYLGVEAYGLIGLLAALTNSLGLLDMSLGQVLSRELARFTGGGISSQSARNLVRSVEFIAGALAVVLVLAIALPADWIAHAWLKPGQIQVAEIDAAIHFMAVIVALRVLEGLYRGAVTGLHRQTALNMITVTCALLKAFGALGLFLFVTRSIVDFFAWQALISALNVALLIALLYASLPEPNLKGTFSLDELQRVSRFAAGLGLVSLLAIALAQTDKLLLSKLLPLAAYGEYTLAATLAAAPHILGAPILQATQPRFARAIAASDTLGLVTMFHGAAQLMSVVAGSAAIVIIVFSGDVLNLWLHNEALALRLAPLVRIMALGSLLNALVWLPHALQIAHGWTTLIIKVNAVAVALLIPGVLLVVPRFGAEGAAWLWVLLNLGFFSIQVPVMFRRLLSSEMARWYRSDVARPLFAAILIAGSIKLCAPMAGDLWSRLLVLALVSAATLGGAAASAPIVRAEVQAMLAKWVRFS